MVREVDRRVHAGDQTLRHAPSVGGGQKSKKRDVYGIQEDLGDRKFWTSPAGIGIMAGGGALALLAIASSGGDDEPQVSPFTP